MQVRYLEIVTPDVNTMCATYARQHGVTFSEPDASLGHARTAELETSVKAYEGLVQALKIRIAKLRRQKFGRSSEKISREIEQLGPDGIVLCL